MDVSAGFDFPNPYGLLAGDFKYDMDAYGIALKFLSDLAGGSDERHALDANGGSVPMLRAWEASPKFRRVLAKCRTAGKVERAATEKRALEAQEQAPDGTDADGADNQSAQRFVALEDVPAQRSPFRQTPARASWGH